MQLKTILNRVQKFKSFVYKSVRWSGSEAEPELEVEMVERANGKPICSGCGHHCPGYDRQPKRRFEFVPLWGVNKPPACSRWFVDCTAIIPKERPFLWAGGEKSGIAHHSSIPVGYSADIAELKRGMQPLPSDFIEFVTNEATNNQGQVFVR